MACICPRHGELSESQVTRQGRLIALMLPNAEPFAELESDTPLCNICLAEAVGAALRNELPRVREK